MVAMTDTNPREMPDLERNIVDAATRCFVRYGPKKTSMNEIAQDAGVSRQTLYDLFGNKDELIRASIRQFSDKSHEALKERLLNCSSLGEKLDAYFEETLVSSFELMQSAGDPEDIMSAHNAAGAQAIQESRNRQKKLISSILSKHMSASHDEKTHARLANYIVTVAMSFKTVKDRQELDELLTTLKEGVLSVSGKT